LSHVRGHARAPTKPHKLGVYNSGGICYLSCARRSCVPSSSGGIRHGVRCVLRVRICCAITLISPLPTVVLRLGAASHDSLRDPEDATRQEANRVHNERQQAWRLRRRVQSATQATMRARGEETPPKPESSGDGNEEEEDDEEREVTPSPHSLPLKTSPHLATSLANKQGSLLTRVGQNTPD
jgi:hypothetical protein